MKFTDILFAIGRVFIKLICIPIINKHTRKKVRSQLTAKLHKFLYFSTCKSFEYRNQTLPLFESDFNCGFTHSRMTERCLELSLAQHWLNSIKDNVIEIGAVSTYYFPNRVKDVCDPYDAHPAVNHKCSLFDLDLTGRNVLSISTIEHIATGDYGLAAKKNEDPVSAFKKIIEESNQCLITFPIGYNAFLDNYFAQQQFHEIKLKNKEKMTVTLFERNISDNRFRQNTNISEVSRIKYGPAAANAVIVIEKIKDL